MVTMLSFWCALRIVYVTAAVSYFQIYNVICWAYPLTWTCSAVVFLTVLLKSDWVHHFDRRPLTK